MTAGQIACEPKAMDARTTVAPSTGFLEQSLTWMVIAYKHGNRTVERKRMPMDNPMRIG